MLRRVKKILVLIVSFVLAVCSLTFTASALPITSFNDELAAMETTIPVDVQQAMESQSIALQAYQNLENSFTKDGEGMPIYPSEFAGAYLDKGFLVIQLTDMRGNIQNEYIKKCAVNKEIRFRQAAYSLNDLAVYCSYVQDYINAGTFLSCGPIIEDNSYVISLNATSSVQLTQSVDTATAVASGMPIKIDYQNQINASATSIYGGDRITNEDTGTSMSVGICGTYNGQAALLTCGHGNEKVGVFSLRYPYITYRTTTNRIGQVAYQRANQAEAAAAQGVNALGDFAIVTLTNNQYTTTNDVRLNIDITGTYSSLPIGTTIYKYGYASGFSYGTVQQYMDLTTVTYSGDGKLSKYYVRGLYKHAVETADGSLAVNYGDSGGSVYIKSGSSYLLHGIVTALGTKVTANDTMYSTPVFFATDVGFRVKTS